MVLILARRFDDVPAVAERVSQIFTELLRQSLSEGDYLRMCHRRQAGLGGVGDLVDSDMTMAEAFEMAGVSLPARGLDERHRQIWDAALVMANANIAAQA